MRRLVLVIGALGVLGAGMASASVDSSRDESNLSDFRVCAYESFSKRLGRCLRDQTGEVLHSSQFVCSAALADPSKVVRVAMSWRYGGGLIWSDKLTGRGRTVWTTFSLGGPFALPGGVYRCRLATGRTSKVAAIESSGPTGNVLDTAICDSRRSHLHYGNRSCLQDDDGETIRPGAGVVCNAAFVKVKGRRVAIRLLDGDGRNVAPPFSAVASTPLYWTYEWTGGRQLPNGVYRCQFVLDGVVESEKSLTIS